MLTKAIPKTHGSALRVSPAAARRCGNEKYGPAGLLASSADRGWSGLSAELRRHSEGAIFDRTVAKWGTIWLTPGGLQEDFVALSDPIPEILHIYLASCHFSPSSLGVDPGKSVIASLRYESGFKDPLVAGIASAIVSELKTQTSAGRMLAETLAASLAARLVQNHVRPSPAHDSPRITQEGLDRRRLSRVLDYVETNLED